MTRPGRLSESCDDGLYARHAAAVADSDPRALDALSTDLEKAGLLLSAADPAAQAVVLYDRSGCNKHSTEAAARALPRS